MLNSGFLIALAGSVTVLLCSCTSTYCIDCSNHNGDLPKTVICQDTYEALPQIPKLSWAEFSNRAIEQGCEPTTR